MAISKYQESDDMDPIPIIVAALTSGALAGLKPTAEQAVKDAYSGLKALILRKYGSVSLDHLERMPDSKIKRDSVAEDLKAAGASNDMELLDQAKALIDTAKKYDHEAISIAGVNIEDVETTYLKIKEAHVKVSSGEASKISAVNVNGSTLTQGIDIGTATVEVENQKKIRERPAKKP